ELHAGAVARVAPRRTADELPAEERDELAAAPRRCAIAAGPRRHLVNDLRGREVSGEGARDPRARELGTGDLLDAHVGIHAKVHTLQLGGHVARLVHCASAHTQVIDELLRGARWTYVPARLASAAFEELPHVL